MVAACMTFLPASVLARPGDLDPTFGFGGIVDTQIGGFSVAPNTILTQPDGKIIVSGRTYDDADNDESYFLARHNSNGTLDATFGTNGIVLAPSFGEVYAGADMALQPDGKIVTVGFGNDNWNGFTITRYNANGTLDHSFGTSSGYGGTIAMWFAPGWNAATGGSVQPNGKIVVVGRIDHIDTPASSNVIIRLNTDGSPDTSFNGTGYVITTVGGNFVVLIQPDGRIITAGSIGDDLTLARFNTNGSLDATFGNGGSVVHSVTGGTDLLRDAAIQPDGKIVVTGWTDLGGTTTNSAVVRYNGDGTIDTSFADNGVLTTENEFNIGNSVVLQANGKLVALGYAGYITGFAVQRLNENGTQDTGFGNNGRVITPNHRAVYDSVIQPDGKILAVGGGYGTSTIEIVRYLGDAVSPRPAQFDFDGDGRSDISVSRPSDRVWYLNQSTSGFSATQFGLTTDQITPGDFDGDGKTDLAVWRPSEGNWYIQRSTAGFTAIQWGLPTDLPVQGDFDGDGKTDIAVWRPSTGIWYLQQSTAGSAALQFGISEDKPLAGDYDGDGKTDLAVYRPSSGTWYLMRSTLGFTAINFGIATDKVVPADYDGDGKADLGVFRNGTWYLLQSS